MNIQVVSEYYYPDNFRINDIVAELVTQGHKVEVITALPDYATGKVPERYRGFRNRREIIFGAETVRIHTSERGTGVFRRALNYGTFMINSFFYSLFCKKPDCDAIFVYETSPVFQALPAIMLKKRTKKKLVLYCCDLWPESLKAWGVKEESFLFKRVRTFSGWLYRQCDVVAISSKPFQEYLERVCGVESNRIVYLPQHCNDDFAEIASVHEENDCIDFMFAGNIGAVQDVDCIVRAVSEIETDKKFCVHIVGDGSEFSHVQELAQQLNLSDRIVFHGRHPVEEMVRFYRMADCFLLTLRGDDSIGMTLPAKSQGYLCAGKPVVAAINGAGADLIREADCGEVVPAGDYRALAQLMSKVIAEFDSYRENGNRGRMYYETHFTKAIFVRNLLKLL